MKALILLSKILFPRCGLRGDIANLVIFKLHLQKQPSEVFCKKGVLRNFIKFTGKHLWQSLF